MSKDSDRSRRIPNLVDRSQLRSVNHRMMLLSKRQINDIKTVFLNNTNIKVIRRVKNREKPAIFTNDELELKLPFNIYQDEERNLYILYTLDSPIGKGGYGRVKLAQSLDTGQWVAVKIEKIPLKKLNRAKKRIQREIMFEKELGLYMGRVVFKQRTHEKHYIFKKYVFGELLMDLIKQKKFKNMLEKIEIGILITQTVNRWHQRGYIHGDIKPRNIIVDLDAKEATLIDFGLSQKSVARDKLIAYVDRAAGTKKFMAPELKISISKEKKQYLMTDKSESYAMGETLRKLLAYSKDKTITNEVKIMIAELVMLLKHPEPNKRIAIEESLERLNKIKDCVEKSIKN